MKTTLMRFSLFYQLKKIKNDPDNTVFTLLYLLGPWFAFAMVEILNENDLLKDFRDWQILMNLIWYYVIFFLCRLILGRRRRAGTLAILLCFAFGLANHFTLRYRGRIIFPADLAALNTVANVAGGYDFSIDLYIVQAFIILISYLFLMFACRPQKKRVRLPRFPAAFLALFTAIYSYAFFGTNMLPDLGIYTQQWSTQTNGFLLNFTVAASYSVVEKPEGYSNDAIADIMDDYSSTEGNSDVPRPDNIIVIMNEAFSDLTIFESLDVSSDPSPFLHSMEENTIKGWLYAPVTGGGTASTEFEFITGFSNRFLPPHCVAYQLYMKDEMPSFSSVAHSLDYYTTAFHPYYASGWNRPIVYEYLEFDKQMYDEDVENPKKVRSFISDETDYKVLTDITSAEQGDANFIFNVTMQNHSGYALNWHNLRRSVTASDELTAADKGADQYLCLVRTSDTALKDLIRHYQENTVEKTLIVFFGDHQPGLTNAFYEVLYGKKLSERTPEEVLQQHAVPFFIWANYDIPEQSDVVLSTGFLHVLAAKVAGLPMTGWMNFLSELYDHLPVITPVGFITADGTVVRNESDLTKEQQEWLHKYQMLCYCGLIDLDDETRPFFRLTN